MCEDRLRDKLLNLRECAAANVGTKEMNLLAKYPYARPLNIMGDAHGWLLTINITPTEVHQEFYVNTDDLLHTLRDELKVDYPYL
jgi:hypothetical protein